MILRRCSIVLLLLSLFLSVDLAAQGRRPPFQNNPITVISDGVFLKGYEVFVIEDRPCMTLRQIRRLFGGRLRWGNVSRNVIYERQGMPIEFQMDASSVTVAGRPVAVGMALRYWFRDLYVPLDLLLSQEFQEFCENKIVWDAGKQVLTVEPQPSVSSPSFYTYPNKSRVVVEIGPRVNYRVMSFRGGLYHVRFFGGRSLGQEQLEIKDGLIETVRLSAHARSADLELKISSKAEEPNIHLLEAPRRLAIDVVSKRPGIPNLVSKKTKGRGEIPPVPGMKGREALEPSLSPGVEEEGIDYAPSSPLLALSPIKTIVVDAGHGGKDAGAIGPHGTLEKDINLQLALTLAKILKREKRFKVVLTRDDDTFISLQERANISNNAKADLFVSIHCNAALNRRTHGFEAYYLSEDATDPSAAAVARRENAVVELEGIQGKVREELRDLLWSMARTETLNESSQLCGFVVSQAEKRLPAVNRGAKQASFHVLRGTDMPAILVESGFISHPKEEARLCSQRYRNKVSDAIFAGLLEYESKKIQSLQSKTLQSTRGN
ncbi:MAG TPA: N-acetylmuramoyl-L-alanine amidase [Elusimicrobiota bacterium]|nr:N-acetylmuramoyl-L-alanine amidase [Elusimicrobiota bacterium]